MKKILLIVVLFVVATFYIIEDKKITELNCVSISGGEFNIHINDAKGVNKELNFEVYTDKTLGENYCVTAFKGHKVTRINFLYVTKIIDEAEFKAMIEI